MRAIHVHEDEVAALHRTVLDRLQRRKTLLQLRQLGIDLLLGDLHLALGHLEPLVLTQGGSRHQLDA